MEKFAEMVYDLKSAKRLALNLQLSEEALIQTRINTKNPLVSISEDKVSTDLLSPFLKEAILNTVLIYIEARESELKMEVEKGEKGKNENKNC